MYLMAVRHLVLLVAEESGEADRIASRASAAPNCGPRRVPVPSALTHPHG
jgi:hypothetical protein